MVFMNIKKTYLGEITHEDLELRDTFPIAGLMATPEYNAIKTNLRKREKKALFYQWTEGYNRDTFYKYLY